MSEHAAKLPVLEALAYGVIQGPTELLPISSSGHLVLAPHLLGSEYVDLDPALRKTFEVALHAGTAAALVIVLRDEVFEAVREVDGRRIGMVLSSMAPAAVAALGLEKVIEGKLSRPEIVVVGLVLGSAAMAWADGLTGTRARADADWRDGLALGFAQAVALIPGVSRSGSTIVAARARGFDPLSATELSMHVALPVIAGATALKAVRARQQGLPRELRAPLLAGVAGAFVSSLASARLLASKNRGRGLMKYVIYRLALAAGVTMFARRRRLDSAQ